VTSAARVERERTLFTTLLDLPEEEQVEDWLKRALDALVDVVNAQCGYVELYRDTRRGERRLSASVRCSAEQEEAIRAVTSRGIVAEAMISGQTVHTPAALLDERFAKQPSVQEQRLEAVLCVPFKDMPGVLYVEGVRGKGPFTPEDVVLAERVAKFLAPILAARALIEVTGTDHTQTFRGRIKVDEIIGTSEALAHVFDQVHQVAWVDIAVLLMGESGTGKTQLARAIHASSRRAAGPFVELNCAAIPESLVESELFGTRQGAFTGARTMPGKVELAEGGTLFLDEVGELPMASQAKLLQLISEKQYFRVGGSKLERANVRLLAATNANLGVMVGNQTFRGDLYHRLSAFVIRVPSLKERRDDLAPLVDALLVKIAREHESPLLKAASSLRTMVEVQEWEGNVRELRNRLEQAVLRARAEGAAFVEGRHLDQKAPAGPTLSLAQATAAFQRDFVRRELESGQWNITQVAKRLELTRQHVYNLIKTYELKREGD
jgi:Nif-specific regulatory protein